MADRRSLNLNSNSNPEAASSHTNCWTTDERALVNYHSHSVPLPPSLARDESPHAAAASDAIFPAHERWQRSRRISSWWTAADGKPVLRSQLAVRIHQSADAATESTDTANLSRCCSCTCFGSERFP